MVLIYYVFIYLFIINVLVQQTITEIIRKKHK
jgi:hypothetical protein